MKSENRRRQGESVFRPPRWRDVPASGVAGDGFGASPRTRPRANPGTRLSCLSHSQARRHSKHLHVTLQLEYQQTNTGRPRILAKTRKDACISTNCLHPADMSKPAETPDIARLRLQEDEEDLFASPESGATTQKHTPSTENKHARSESRHDAAEARDARLQAELERVREVNRVIEGVTASLEKAKANMGTVHQTVNNASTLLATWTRILGQTEHNQRLILNPQWNGATQDLEDMENEEVRRQAEAERRLVEEQRRREEAQRKVEEDERKRAAAAAAPTRGVGRMRSTRGVPSSTTSRYTGVGGQTGRGRGTTAASRGSGIGRGTSATRGRGRG